MLTVAEMLQVPLLKAARLVAGEKGRNNAIEWVIPPSDSAQTAHGLREGALLFIPARDLWPPRGSSLVADLVGQKAAGAVVISGDGGELPPAPLEKANALDFPIVLLPAEIAVDEAVCAVSERVLAERYSLMQKSLQIHNTLTQVVLRGQDLKALARALAELVHCAVIIRDPSFRPLAHASWDGLEAAKREQIEQAGAPRALLIELGKRGVLTELRRSRQPMRIPPLPDQGFVLERIVAPIVAGQEFYGYVWIVVRDSANDELDMIAIQHAATVAALILLKEREVYEVEQRLKSAFLDELLTGDADLQRTLMARSRQFQFDLTQGQQILLLRLRDQVSLSSLHRWLEDLLSARHVSGLTVRRAQHLVLLLPNERTKGGERLAKRLWEQGQADGYDLLVGVGRVYTGWDRLSESYEEAQEALEIGPPLTGRPVVCFDDLGVLHWLRHLPPEVRAQNRFSRVIEKLAREDANRQGDLVETLETYLDAGQNGQEAARQLYIHRNTLRQRLDKIEAICNLTLSDPLVDLNLHIALKEFKLRQQE